MILIRNLLQIRMYTQCKVLGFIMFIMLNNTFYSFNLRREKSCIIKFFTHCSKFIFRGIEYNDIFYIIFPSFGHLPLYLVFYIDSIACKDCIPPIFKERTSYFLTFVIRIFRVLPTLHIFLIIRSNAMWYIIIKMS